MYSLTYFDEFDEERQATFKPNEYYSLMELLFDKYLEDWGECKGRAWCGTCRVQILEGTITEVMGVDEIETLSKMNEAGKDVRLACQIPLTAALDKLVFKIV